MIDRYDPEIAQLRAENERLKAELKKAISDRNELVEYAGKANSRCEAATCELDELRHTPSNTAMWEKRYRDKRAENERLKAHNEELKDDNCSLSCLLEHCYDSMPMDMEIEDDPPLDYHIRTVVSRMEKAEAELASGILLKEHGVDERPEQSGNYLCRASRCFDSIDYGKKEFKFIRFCVDSMKWETSWRILEWYELPAKEEGE